MTVKAQISNVFFGDADQQATSKAGENVTQMHYARAGIITPEMEYIAIRVVSVGWKPLLKFITALTSIWPTNGRKRPHASCVSASKSFGAGVPDLITLNLCEEVASETIIPANNHPEAEPTSSVEIS